jgi:hypothetical protein
MTRKHKHRHKAAGANAVGIRREASCSAPSELAAARLPGGVACLFAAAAQATVAIATVAPKREGRMRRRDPVCDAAWVISEPQLNWRSRHALR